jgi:guanylate kinase
LLKKKYKGVLVVISSPSGAGKTTIAKKLVSKKLNIELSISLTTRKPRPKEVDGIDYHFVSKVFFKKKINQNSFLEHAKVFDNFYGTIKKDITDKLKKGINILLDIDWQGARQVRKKMPNDVLSIFILPPSLKELKKRLKKRENNIFFINKRMSKAKKEIAHWREYDNAIINKDLKKCIKEIKIILDADRSRPSRKSISKF